MILSSGSFFCFLMRRALSAPIAKFGEFNFSLHLLFIFLAPVVNSLTLGAGQFY